MTVVAFAIPAHNEERLVGATVGSIHEACKELGLMYEVFVCDDASDDGTKDVAERAGARVVRIETRRIASARNAAAQAALHNPAVSTLFFVDADTRVTPKAVGEAMEALKDGAVGGGAPIVFDAPVPRWSVVVIALTQWMFRRLKLAGGCYIFCKRSAYEAIGGWDETVYAGEEILFAKAAKNQGRFVIIRAPVITSGRKLRAHSAGELSMTLLHFILHGRRAVSTRDGLNLWYAPRKPDPLDTDD